ncbi:hypothetical protein SAMN04488101_1284 [Pedobacter nyackensis]|uniref:Uncharacterized protein n=1 Tax=Pedobacter nyackensis TaxID=475255 RepID=A0A1W2F9L2_9SPHI|nr:hypothetical protein SAMN04488101_1284 [Pedobacter nyackensis]
MPGWELENVVEIQRKSPYTFYKPSDSIIDQLIPGEAPNLYSCLILMTLRLPVQNECE